MKYKFIASSLALFHRCSARKDEHAYKIEDLGDRIRDKIFQRNRFSENPLILGLLDF
jgi:hypothetical protein